MINRIKASLKAKIMWQTGLGELIQKIYEYKNFTKHSFALNKLKSKENYIAFITKQYHIVEKGMALPNPRKGFGKEKINLLIDVVEDYEQKFHSYELGNYVRAVLTKYLERNELYLEEAYASKIKRFIKDKATPTLAGVKKIDADMIHSSVDFNLKEFLNSRSSVRNFSDKEVELNKIQQAIELARNTPSVCNRQSWKVHLFEGEKMKTLLKMQGGNGGFTDSVNKVMIVTVDVRKFTKMESNQIYVDGGLFSMNLLLALHYNKIATCTLNMCKPFTELNDIAQFAGIPKNERIILMIALGNYLDDFEVAVSPKKAVDEILIYNRHQ